jgi:hypothetical protein
VAPVLGRREIRQIRERREDPPDQKKDGRKLRLRTAPACDVLHRERDNDQREKRYREDRVARDDVPDDVVLVREVRDPERCLVMENPRRRPMVLRPGSECIEGVQQVEHRPREKAGPSEKAGDPADPPPRHLALGLGGHAHRPPKRRLLHFTDCSDQRPWNQHPQLPSGQLSNRSAPTARSDDPCEARKLHLLPLGEAHRARGVGVARAGAPPFGIEPDLSRASWERPESLVTKRSTPGATSRPHGRAYCRLRGSQG